MKYRAVPIAEKFDLVGGHWQPRVIAELNDYQLKIVKVQGDFVWHSHDDTDEAFIVIEGELRVDFRDGSVTIGPGELYVVPKGVEHKPFSLQETKVMIVEPRGILNTGDTGGEMTAENDIWV